MADIGPNSDRAIWELRGFRALVGELTNFVWQSDITGEPVGDSSGWEKFTGQTRDQITSGGWAEAVHPEDRAHVLEVALSAIVGQVPWQVEGRLRRHDGVWRHMVAYGVPVRCDGGVVHGWIGSCQDVTERKEAENSLARLNQDLEARVVKRTLALTEEIRRREDAQRALLLSQERYTLVENPMRDGIWDLDLISRKNLSLAILESGARLCRERILRHV